MRVNGVEVPDPWFMNGSPDYQHYVYDYLTPQQQAAWAPYMSPLPAQEAAPTEQAPAGPEPGTDYSMYGLQAPDVQGDPLGINRLVVPNAPQLSTDPTQFNQARDETAGQIGNAWDFQTPQAQAAQIALGLVPQPNAEQYGTSPELQRMLAGQGYSDDILAKMHAGATENPANAGLQELAAARRALSMSGLSDSPAGAAVQADVARRTGQAQTAANRDVDVQNAQAGLENFRTGVGMQTQIGLSNMQAANQMALNNANRLFSAISQNNQYQQQANMGNAAAENARLTNQANDKSNFLSSQGNLWQQQANQRDLTNNQNQLNQQNMQFASDKDTQNQLWNEFNNRYQLATKALTGFNPMAG